MKKRLTLVLALALCTVLLCVNAAASDTHSGHSGWTELTEAVLTQDSYTLTDGEYYLGDSITTTSTQLVVTGDVTLCLNGKQYTYIGDGGSAIKVEAGASLTVCNCQEQGYLFNISASKGAGAVIENYGTLYYTGGSIQAATENSAAIWNHGSLTVSGGSISATAQEGAVRKTAYGIYNAQGATLTISGLPSITGSQPGPINPPTETGPRVDILTYGAIDVSDFDVDTWWEQLLGYSASSYNISFQGEPSGTILTGLNTWSDKSYLDSIFCLVYPENAETNYDAEEGTLSLAESTSLTFCGQNVLSGRYYKVEEYENTQYPGIYASQLIESTADNYNIYWDEESKTLTLNTIEAVAHRDYFSDGLFAADCECLTVQLIGENKLTVISSVLNVVGPTYSISNTGNIVLKNASGETGSLIVNLELGRNNGDDIAAIHTDGDVENQTNLTVNGIESNDYQSQTIFGVNCASFTNSGSFAMNPNGLGKNVTAVCCEEAFVNNGAIDIDIAHAENRGENGIRNGIGIVCGNFTNSGKIDIDICALEIAQGIKGSGGETWSNEAGGEITIAVGTTNSDPGTTGSGAGELGGNPLAGVYLCEKNGENDVESVIHFTNGGTLVVSATSGLQSKLPTVNSWPTWQFFDTIGVGIASDEVTFVNTGTMNLTAENGYTAGLYISGGNERIDMKNSGDLTIEATTMGGANVRAVGIFAQLIDIQDGQVQELPFLFNGGSASISAAPASGYESSVIDGGCVAICFSQLFEEATAPEGIPDGLQQITFDGMSIAGRENCIVTGPWVIKDFEQPEEVNYYGYINTFASGDAPASSIAVLPTIPGSVMIEGTARVDSNLSAEVSGLPEGLEVTYQWQWADSAEGPFTDIVGATDSEYVPTYQNIGKYLRVVVEPTGGKYAGELMATTSTAVMPPLSEPTYSIAIQDATNGTVTCYAHGAAKDAVVTLHVKADVGYQLDKLTVTDASGNVIDVEKVNNTTYTFVMPGSKVTVEAIFAPTSVEPSDLPFTDVSTSDWFYGAVKFVYENGLMDGVGNNLFAPNATLNRAMAVTILYRLEGSPAVTTDAGFNDVAAGTWYTDAVNWAAANNIVNGVEGNNFDPTGSLTREQMATVLYRYAQYKGADVSASGDLSGFVDSANVSSWAADAVKWAVGSGLVNGVEGNALAPQGTSTRAQAATILMRFVG